MDQFSHTQKTGHSHASALAMVFSSVLRHATAASEPCEGARDHPSSGSDFKSGRGVGALDDLDGPAPDLLRGPPQLWPAIAAIGEAMTQQRRGRGDGFQHLRRTIAILNIGPVADKADQKRSHVRSHGAP